MRFYEITPESPAYAPLVEVWERPKQWLAAKEELETLIGGPVSQNMAYSVKRLMLTHVPEALECQFTKQYWGECRKAKIGSAINNKFLEIVAAYDLKDTTLFSVAEILGTVWSRGAETYYPAIEGKYYFGTERKIENYTGLIEITEPCFLRLRAAWMEQTSFPAASNL